MRRGHGRLWGDEGATPMPEDAEPGFQSGSHINAALCSDGGCRG
ncbi:hypothetical protein GbCGDNIH1_8003 [Granulibacter bethesdensis CGDNIH1]|uniref:Uncharacterized protein n=1 Tax=Granulibacter bethesdensis (strain ATCC BAA-1260 / CGDNIH1) TaxID=391165 RepID=A0A286M2T8_GRABC|nr:hypothetical protein GbCGDNIH5_8003 [Granulibacter bethesdensis]APH63449.1 hypothetical protein GbCGDNIH1I4_8003 [Granulibacter bethesdensis]ASV62337.1 hypothetical protein GbCGDNIH1_8003 [Granulibacter bethesdensis CGDNIH1]